MKRRTDDHPLEAHVFVCTTDREEHACCADAEGEAVAEAVKEWLRD
ncbi:MAG: hypothetical protein PPP58_06080 [Natronomonas sp.]